MAVLERGQSTSILTPLMSPSSTAAGRVLIVEDDPDIAHLLSHSLKRAGFGIETLSSGQEVIAAVRRQRPDLVLLDLMLPGLDGLEVCRSLRGDPLTAALPVIMLTARAEESDRIVGLELGADDYITKPFSPNEVVARVRALLRRAHRTESHPLLRYGPIIVDIERHVVTVGGEQVSLPLKEFELLEMLLRNSGRVLTRGQLIDRVWGSDYVGDTKTLDVHVKRLRSKVEPDPSAPRHLITVRGLGYKFDP